MFMCFRRNSLLGMNHQLIHLGVLLTKDCMLLSLAQLPMAHIFLSFFPMVADCFFHGGLCFANCVLAS